LPSRGVRDHGRWQAERERGGHVRSTGSAAGRCDTRDVPDLRLTELVAAISLATDLGTGQPLEHALRTCLLARALGGELGLDAATSADVHHVALLRFLGCTSDTPETARLAGGDNLALLAAAAPVFMGSSGEMLAVVARRVGAGQPPLRRAGLVLDALNDPGGRSLLAHCEVGARLAARLGLGAGVVDALDHAYERWDGRGLRGIAGEDVPVAVRVVVVARDVVLWRAAAGPEAAAAVLARRRGRAYDPAVVDAMRAVRSPEEVDDAWERVLDGEPEPVRRVGEVALDRALDAVGDFADLRSRWTRGRSRRLAEVSMAAGRVGLPAAELRVLRRAALVADLGAVGVPAGIWDRPAPLGVRDTERLRLHPYLSERVLGRCTGLAPVAALAGAHHERLDGSGYHRGSVAAQLPRAARLLAAADVWTALGEERAHRPALPAGAARDVVWSEVTTGRLDGPCVEAVLAAAGQGAGRRPAALHPAGLSDREIEVLRLIARGATNRTAARSLGISAKTVGHHVGHIYTKIGVTTRPAAALFAMEHDLLR
jgi:HD-GYP domain-containing protein (c-di-GMP phosphodiesterase class II)